ncbi:hypothetical protein WISP_46377 [Willisornis vidua]|uniref:Uncharacterized protein n=1 Tax=Willisornis vidua TaxID=1566151 RepID=A0ABQ9DF83_9PASS|nr:hypothetical protein WISP_46377 [Willisornis vidua]
MQSQHLAVYPCIHLPGRNRENEHPFTSACYDLGMPHCWGSGEELKQEAACLAGCQKCKDKAYKVRGLCDVLISWTDVLAGYLTDEPGYSSCCVISWNSSVLAAAIACHACQLVLTNKGKSNIWTLIIQHHFEQITLTRRDGTSCGTWTSPLKGTQEIFIKGEIEEGAISPDDGHKKPESLGLFLDCLTILVSLAIIEISPPVFSTEFFFCGM